MAHTVTGPSVVGGNKDGSVKLVLWETLGPDEAGTAVSLPEFADMTVHPIGTFNGGTVTIEGSLDGTTWATLNDPSSTALTFTSSRMEAVLENPLYIRPHNSNTAGMDIDVYLLVRRTSSLRT